jgi:hypothetical protein
MRIERAALALVLLLCLVMTAHQLRRPTLADFQVYETASVLLVHHQRSHIYDDADTGVDPQIRFSSPDTVFARTAQRDGISRVRLYVYPPILADLITPLALLPLRVAGELWLVLNFAALLLTVWITSRLIALPLMSYGTLALTIGLFSLFATGMGLIWGQVTILLVLLWAIGMYAYAQDRKGISAFALALATAIKLTPLMIVVPFVFWGDWKWLRDYVGSFAVLIAAMFVCNGASVIDYVTHVMPSMSAGVPNLENKSLVSSVELVYAAMHGGAVRFETMAVPHSMAAVAKAVALLAGIAVLYVAARAGRRLSMAGRMLTFALIALVSTCISPVSWKHAYVVEFLPLALLWADALRRKSSFGQLALLTLCSIELGSFFFDSIAAKLLHGLPLALESFFAPLCGIVLALYFLRSGKLSVFRMSPEANAA